MEVRSYKCAASALRDTTALTGEENLRLAPSACATLHLGWLQKGVCYRGLSNLVEYIFIRFLLACGFCNHAGLGICFSLFKAATFIPFHKMGEKYSAFSPVVSWHLPPKFCFTNTGQNAFVYQHLVYKRCKFPSR